MQHNNVSAAALGNQVHTGILEEQVILQGGLSCRNMFAAFTHLILPPAKLDLLEHDKWDGQICDVRVNWHKQIKTRCRPSGQAVTKTNDCNHKVCTETQQRPELQ